MGLSKARETFACATVPSLAKLNAERA